jgi:hypothetical protein
MEEFLLKIKNLINCCCGGDDNGKEGSDISGVVRDNRDRELIGNGEVILIKNSVSIKESSPLFLKEDPLVRDPIIERGLEDSSDKKNKAKKESFPDIRKPFEIARKKLAKEFPGGKLPFPSPYNTEEVKSYQELIRKKSDEIDKNWDSQLVKEREARAKDKLSFHTRIINKEEFKRA